MDATKIGLFSVKKHSGDQTCIRRNIVPTHFLFSFNGHNKIVHLDETQSLLIKIFSYNAFINTVRTYFLSLRLVSIYRYLQKFCRHPIRLLYFGPPIS